MKIFIISLFLFAAHKLVAQEYIAHSHFRNISMTETDSLLTFSTFDEQFFRASAHDSFYVTTEIFPLLLIEEITTGVQDLPIIPGIHLQTNISTQEFILEKNLEENLNTLMTDMAGRVFHKGLWTAHMPRYDIYAGMLPAGIYILLVTDEKATKANQYKLIKI
jgi:hypothetical protein